MIFVISIFLGLINACLLQRTSAAAPRQDVRFDLEVAKDARIRSPYAQGCRAASRPVLDAELRVAPVRELPEPEVERGADGQHVLLHRRRRAAQREPVALEASLMPMHLISV